MNEQQIYMSQYASSQTEPVCIGPWTTESLNPYFLIPTKVEANRKQGFKWLTLNFWSFSLPSLKQKEADQDLQTQLLSC